MEKTIIAKSVFQANGKTMKGGQLEDPHPADGAEREPVVSRQDECTERGAM